MLPTLQHVLTQLLAACHHGNPDDNKNRSSLAGRVERRDAEISVYRIFYADRCNTVRHTSIMPAQKNIIHFMSLYDDPVYDWLTRRLLIAWILPSIAPEERGIYCSSAIFGSIWKCKQSKTANHLPSHSAYLSVSLSVCHAIHPSISHWICQCLISSAYGGGGGAASV